MATVELPNFDHKTMWRRLRAGLWTAVVALAAAAIIVPMFEPLPFLTPLRNWLILLAAAVLAWPYFAKRWGV